MDLKNNTKAVKRSASIIKSYKDIFLSPVGQKVLMDLIRKHDVLEPYLDEDPLMLAQQSGARAVVLGIIKMLSQNEIKMIEDYHKYLETENNGEE
jgi:hypothetical protein